MPTTVWAGHKKRYTWSAVSTFAQAQPAGRWGETSDLVGACRFLASAASDYVNGIVIAVDGGYAASDGLDRS